MYRHKGCLAKTSRTLYVDFRSSEVIITCWVDGNDRENP